MNEVFLPSTSLGGIGLDHSKGVVAGSGQNENHKHLKEWKYE